MDEESLFRDIHRHLLHRAKEADAVDTEATLAERFNVSRYRVRRVLDKLAQLGVVARAQKRGVTVLPPDPKLMAENIEEQISASSVDVRELLEARERTEGDLLALSIRRLTPVLFGRLEEKVPQMQNCVEFHAAVLKLHAALHREIIESCGNRILTAYALALLGFIEKLFAEQAHFDHELVSRLVSGNARLVTALKAEDIAAARESLKEVLEAEAEAVLEAERRLAAEEAGAASS